MKKKTGWIVLIAVIAVVALVVGWGVGSYNSLVTMQESVENKQAAIQTQLQRRSDLIPNLVNTVKGYAKHEQEVYTAISDARSKLAGAKTLSEQDAANTELTSALNRLLVVVENYPDLKANQNFINLQDELAGTENRLQKARQDYNDTAKEYNAKIRRFPTSIIAGMGGFDKVDYFQSQAGAENAPDVSF